MGLNFLKRVGIVTDKRRKTGAKAVSVKKTGKGLTRKSLQILRRLGYKLAGQKKKKKKTRKN